MHQSKRVTTSVNDGEITLKKLEAALVMVWLNIINIIYNIFITKKNKQLW